MTSLFQVGWLIPTVSAPMTSTKFTAGQTEIIHHTKLDLLLQTNHVLALNNPTNINIDLQLQLTNLSDQIIQLNFLSNTSWGCLLSTGAPGNANFSPEFTVKS